VTALADMVELVIQRGVVATPVGGGLLLRLAPAQGQAAADGEDAPASPRTSDVTWLDGSVRKSW